MSAMNGGPVGTRIATSHIPLVSNNSSALDSLLARVESGDIVSVDLSGVQTRDPFVESILHSMLAPVKVIELWT